MALKTFLVGLTMIVKHLCHYYVRYASTIITAIDASALSDGEKTQLKAFLNTVQASCALLELITGY